MLLACFLASLFALVGAAGARAKGGGALKWMTVEADYSIENPGASRRARAQDNACHNSACAPSFALFLCVKGLCGRPGWVSAVGRGVRMLLGVGVLE